MGSNEGQILVGYLSGKILLSPRPTVSSFTEKKCTSCVLEHSEILILNISLVKNPFLISKCASL